MKGPQGHLTAHAENAGGVQISLGESKVKTSDQILAKNPAGDKTSAGTPATFFVRYEERATPDERNAAIDKLFAAGAPLETLLLFEHSWTDPQRSQVLDRFASHPPKSVEAWLTIASIQHRARHDDQAREALRRSAVLLRVEQDASSLRSKLTQLAKDLGDEKLIEKLDAAPPDFDLLKELGFVELSADGGSSRTEFEFGDAANYFVRNAQDRWRIVRILAQPTAQGSTDAYQLGVSQIMPHGSSFSSGQELNERRPVRHELSLEDAGRLLFEIIKQPGQPRFTVTTRIESAPAAVAPVPQVQAADPASGV
jgi:hypothetical protein